VAASRNGCPSIAAWLLAELRGCVCVCWWRCWPQVSAGLDSALESLACTRHERDSRQRLQGRSALLGSSSRLDRKHMRLRATIISLLRHLWYTKMQFYTSPDAEPAHLANAVELATSQKNALTAHEPTTFCLLPNNSHRSSLVHYAALTLRSAATSFPFVRNSWLNG
jgi:hypothetical protein